MRILVVTSMYPPHHYGGYELLCQAAVHRLRAEGHEVVVLTSDVVVPGVAGDEDRAVRRELGLYWRDHDVVRPSLPAVLQLERRNQRALSRALGDHRPDLVSFWAMGATSLGLVATVQRRGIPAAFVVCDDWLAYGPQVDRWTRLGRRAGAWFRRIVAAAGLPGAPDDLGAAGAFCFISRWTQAQAERHGGVRPARATVGYAGVDLGQLPLAAAEGLPWRWRLLHVGRLDERKGIDVAIRALAQLPAEATLQIVGRGDDTHRRALERLATEVGVAERVSFSTATRQELAATYADADVVLFPTRWQEPFGLVPLEAMARATPVVATGTGGSGEYLLDGRNCLRVPVDDATAVAAAVRRLAGDEALRARLVGAGLATAEALDLRHQLDLLVDLHLAAVDGGPLPERLPVDDVVAAL